MAKHKDREFSQALFDSVQGIAGVAADAAFLAAAAYRQVRFGQLLATGDDVSGSEGDPRHTEEHTSFPERLFWLSVEACIRL